MLPVWDKGVLALLGTIIVSTLSLVGPWLSKFLVDDAFPNQDWDLLHRIFLALIALAMIVVMLLRPRGLWPSPEHGKSLASK